MDAKTAVELCRKHADLALSVSNREFYSEIADFIEQQEKYDELGRLAEIGFNRESPDWNCKGILKSPKCEETVDSFTGCDWLGFCEKRAELLTEVQP